MSIIIPRSVWGPRHDNGFSIIGVSAWLAAGKEIWLHHSVTNPPGPSATLEQDCAHMRDFEQIGENRFGRGISYTWVIMPSGRVFQGHDIDRQGSHTYQRNDRSRAICFAGNYDVNALPDKMAASAAALLRELDATIDGPHSQVYPTACPGKYAKARIQEINAATSGGAPIKGDDDVLNEQQLTVTNSPDAPYKEMADIALGATTGNVRSIRVTVDAMADQVDDIAERLGRLESSGVPVDVALSDEDVDRVAERLAEKLSARMQD